jgi:hypothetical protein
LTSGGQRLVDNADGAHVSGAFFVITRRTAASAPGDTILTLLARDVVGAEIVKEGAVTEYVPGAGQRPE